MNAITEHLKPFFGEESIRVVKLTDWMEWAAGKSGAQHSVVLPMIQRGSVWAPHKILDLWDTLLRGMPVGAFMASQTVGGPINRLGEKGTRMSMAGDISLIDGQQRTLSMLAGWPQGLEKPLRPVAIWLDLLDSPQGEYQFRLWATTKSQPFGYSRASIGGQRLSKLERKKLRLANQAYHPSEGKIDAQDVWGQAAFRPWESKFALPLTALIENKETLMDFVVMRLTEYKKALALKSEPTGTNETEKDVAQHFARKLSELPDVLELEKHIPALEKALGKLCSCKFPVIEVNQESFTDDDQSTQGDNDPPLAILFKRVGTGGEPLSNADYVYSVIKHHSPQVHGMVEELLEDEAIRAVYTPTTLVMSAVRLTIMSMTTDGSKGQKLTDTAKLDKAVFARVVRNHVGFISEFEKNIQPEGSFVTGLKQILESIRFTPGFTTGLPRHALCLIQIPLLETILAWNTLCKPSPHLLHDSRLAMTRFLLQGSLCITDYAKASEEAIKTLKQPAPVAGELFPDQKLLNLLDCTEPKLAFTLPSPDDLSNIEGLTTSLLPVPANGLRGSTRFEVKDEKNRQPVEIYRRWWNRKGGHVHPMLLWLQRDYLDQKFGSEPALAGMDEETPYDFDHLLPSAHWAYWTGAAGDNKFISFPLKNAKGEILDKTGHWYIGNSLGNLHVLDSSENRILGDTWVNGKLENEGFAKNAQMPANSEAWSVASGDEDKPRHWELKRALAFQTAVEQRTFVLYKKFYEDLRCGA